uniref:Solute carrier family 2 member 7 n=1 Tax=Myotis lucifugus TaxID=59463 RepID=G1PG88_MYOLU
MDLISASSLQRLQPTLVLATLSAGFGSAFQYGYNIAVVNTPHKVLKSFYNDTYYARHGTSMDEKHMLLLWSCTVSMFPLGGLLGSLMVGGLVDKCGRKELLKNCSPSVPTHGRKYRRLKTRRPLPLVHRLLVLLEPGISYSALPMYLGELAPKNLRGTLGTMTEVFVIVGVFLAQIFSLQPVLGNPTGTQAVRAKMSDRPCSLCQVLPQNFWSIRKPLDSISRAASQSPNTTSQLFAQLPPSCPGAPGPPKLFAVESGKAGQWPTPCASPHSPGLLFQINYYADMIYASAGISAAHSQYVTVGAGVVNIVMTGVSAGTVEWLGRRLLLLVGYGICGSACLVLTLALLFQIAVHGLSYLGVICVFSYIAGHSIGPSPVPSVVRTEIFLQSSRPAAFMVDGAVHWLTNFIVGFMFPSVQEAIGAYSFIVFAGICLLTAVYIYVVIPETKGQTFVEINRIFAKRNGVEIPEPREETTGVEPHASPP